MNVTHVTQTLTVEEAEHVACALDMRINYIETGNATLSRNDAIERNASVIVREGANKITDASTRAQLIEVKSLTQEQMKLVDDLKRLRNNLQKMAR